LPPLFTVAVSNKQRVVENFLMLTIQAHLRLNFKRIVKVETADDASSTHFVTMTPAAHRQKNKTIDTVLWWPQEGSPRDLYTPKKRPKKQKVKFFDPMRRSLDSSTKIFDSSTNSRISTRHSISFPRKEEASFEKRNSLPPISSNSASYLQWNRKVKVVPHDISKYKKIANS
jgi:hypothetical protein